jgi:hypothetical protein
MDPDEALRALRRLADTAEAPEAWADYFSGLDDWLTGGGFLPAQWRRAAGVAPNAPATADTSEGHHITTERRGAPDARKYRGLCTCGWRGRFQPNKLAASSDAQQHAVADLNDNDSPSLTDWLTRPPGYATADEQKPRPPEVGEDEAFDEAVAQASVRMLAEMGDDTPASDPEPEPRPVRYDPFGGHNGGPCSCRSGYASNPGTHNNQVRAYGRCSCECHGRR